MKNIILFSAVALWLLALGGCEKEKIVEYEDINLTKTQKIFIYNMKGEKEYLTETDSLIQIKFIKNIDKQIKNQIVYVFTAKNFETITDRVTLKYNHNQRYLLKKYQSHQNVKYINKSLKNNSGFTIIATDKIMVKLKADKDINDILDKLNIAYENIKALGSSKNSYLILLKDGNSINVANILFETGLFELSQPSFTSFRGLQNPFYKKSNGD